MTLLPWRADLALDEPTLDTTHQEFLALLNALAASLQAGAAREELLAALQTLLDHTEAHFAMEEGWMAATGFAPENCHTRQHATVLEVMRLVQAHMAGGGDLAPLGELLKELAQWFPAHAEMMDAALVYQMRQVGFEPAAGQVASTTPSSASA